MTGGLENEIITCLLIRDDGYGYSWIRCESCLSGFKNVGLKKCVSF